MLSLESPEEIASRYPLLEDIGDRAILCAPLLVGEYAVGAIQMAFRSARQSDPGRQAFLSIVARQCAAALDRARRFETEREIAETLQQSVLPERLPKLPGISLAARYLPGSSGLDVGGDWYDVIQFGENQVGVVVGDVMGKGVRAAAAMAQLRNGLRAYALEGYKPGAVLERLNRLAESSDAPFATVVYVVVDSATGVARYANAGHPPVLLVRRDGGRELLELGSGLPLAVDPDAHYRTGVAELQPGDLLMLYTDGLVESRQRPIAQGIEQLRTAVRSGRDLDQVLTDVLDTLLESDQRRDDVAVLAVRLEASLAPLDLELPRTMPSLAALRAELLPWLARAGATRSQTQELAIATWRRSPMHSSTPGSPATHRFTFTPSATAARSSSPSRTLAPGRTGSAERPRTGVVRHCGPHDRARDRREPERDECPPATDARTMSTSLRVEVTTGPKYSVAVLEGEITLLTARSAGRRLDQLVDTGDLVLDLSELAFLDSAGVHLLFKAARRAQERGSRLSLVSPEGTPIRRVLQIADPVDFLSTRTTEQAAAETLATPD